MSFLSGILDYASHAVAPALQVGAARAQGQLLANQRNQQMMLQQIALARQAEKDRIAAAVAQSTMGKNAAQGRYADARVGALEHPQTSLSYQTDKDGNVVGLPTKISAGQPITPVETGVKGQPKLNPIQVHEANRQFDVDHPLPVQPSFTFPTVADSTGRNVVAVANTKTGKITPTTLDAKSPASQGGGGSAPVSQRAMFMGEVARKAADVLPFIEKGDISLMGATARDVAQEGLAHMPGSKALGNFAMNHISPDLAAYNAGAAELSLNAGHALGGVRGGSESQMKKLGQSLELQTGDAPVARQQKIHNIADLLSSMFASLPPDLRQQQINALGADRVAALRKYGFDPEHALPLQYIDNGGAGSGPVAPDLTDVHAYLKHLRGGKP